MFAVCEPKDELQHEEILKAIHEHVTKTLPSYAQPAFLKIGAIEASHNHKVPKNQFKNQKLPKGEDGKEMIYWLNGDKYTELTEDDWSLICAGKAKL